MFKYSLLEKHYLPATFAIDGEKDCGGYIVYEPFRLTKANLIHPGHHNLQSSLPGQLNKKTDLYAYSENHAISMFGGISRIGGFTHFHTNEIQEYLFCIIGSSFASTANSVLKSIRVKYNLLDSYVMPLGYAYTDISCLPIKIVRPQHNSITIGIANSFSPIFETFEASKYFFGPDDTLNKLSNIVNELAKSCHDNQQWFGLKKLDSLVSYIEFECNTLFSANILSSYIEESKKLGQLLSIMVGIPIIPVNIDLLIEESDSTGRTRSFSLLTPSSEIRQDLIPTTGEELDFTQHPTTVPKIVGLLPDLINNWFSKYSVLAPIINTYWSNLADSRITHFHLSRNYDAINYMMQLDKQYQCSPTKNIFEKYTNIFIKEMLQKYLQLTRQTSYEDIGIKISQLRSKTVHPQKPHHQAAHIDIVAKLLEVIMRSYVLKKIGLPDGLIDDFQYVAGVPYKNVRRVGLL